MRITTVRTFTPIQVGDDVLLTILRSGEGGEAGVKKMEVKVRLGQESPSQ